MSKMTLGQHQEAFMRDFRVLLNWLDDGGYDVRGGELYRTPEQQQIYLNTGRSKTNRSNHLVKCAIDIFIFKDGVWLKSKEDLQHIGDYWEALNSLNRWGGNWKSFIDTPHFERNVQSL